MSTAFPFQIFIRAPSKKHRNKKLALKVDQINSSQVRFRLSSSRPTTFYAQLPPYLLQNEGFYLGQIVRPQILVNGQFKYLNLSSDVYDLVDSNNQLNFGFQFLQSHLKWDRLISLRLDKIQLLNFNRKASAILFQKVSSSCVFSRSQLVFPLSDCTLTEPAAICGTEACPEDFYLNSQGICQDLTEISGRLSFGLRYLDMDGNLKVVTYRRVSDQEIIFEYVSPEELSSQGNSSEPIRERWFFIDTPNSSLEEDVSYPIYVNFGGIEKLYLTSPQNLNECSFSETSYQIVTSTTNPVLTFRPSTVANYNSPAFSEQDFTFVDFPNLDSSEKNILLWKGLSFSNLAVVVSEGTFNSNTSSNTSVFQSIMSTSTSSQTINGFLDPRQSGTTTVPGDIDFDSSQINTNPNVSARGESSNLVELSSATGSNQTTTSIFSNATFWVFLILFILLAAIFLAFIWNYRTIWEPTVDTSQVSVQRTEKSACAVTDPGYRKVYLAQPPSSSVPSVQGIVPRY